MMSVVIADYDNPDCGCAVDFFTILLAWLGI